MDYDQYRSIRFRPEVAIWRNQSPFELQLFHPGFIYREPIRIYLIENNEIEEIPFEKENFSYDGSAAVLNPIVNRNFGYAGFRIHYPLNNPEIKDEVDYPQEDLQLTSLWKAERSSPPFENSG
jgi:glucans biosynthesis protein